MPLTSQTRLKQQIDFVREIDKLKGITRRSLLFSRERYENSAEHSWHISIMATVLSEYAPAAIDTQHVVQLLLIHDIVEIDADDVFIYDEAGQAAKGEKEQAARDRLFGILPEDQAEHFVQLWNEFETGTGAEARFARSVDRLMPLLHNYYNEGAAWKKYGVTSDKVFKVNSSIADGAPALWDLAKSLIEDAIAQGWLSE